MSLCSVARSVSLFVACVSCAAIGLVQAGCSSEDSGALVGGAIADDGGAPEVEFVPGPEADPTIPQVPDPSEADASDSGFDPTKPVTPPDPTQPPSCKKHITVIATVGVPGASKFKGNGCWKVVVTDGAAKADWRKCSTVSFKVGNANAPNYAYDDTSPTHNLAAEKDFLAKCSNGATGDGYEFMAYRSGWRLLSAPRLKAYFAELYGGSKSDIDSLWFQNGVYKNNAALKTRKNVYPMINSGPPKAAKLEKKLGTDALAICKTVPDNGYFGIYNASYTEGMEANDPRLIALENALDACTKK